MKFLGCFFLLLIMHSHTFAQGLVIESAPLSVEDNGVRKIINRADGETPSIEKAKNLITPPDAEALVIINDDVINPPEGISETKHIAKEVIPANNLSGEKIKLASPIDGQLKLNGEASTNLQSIPNRNAKGDLFLNYKEPILNNYLQFSFGYLDSKYKKIHSSLKNGSSVMSFKFVADVSSQLQSGFAVEVLSDKSGQSLPDSIRALQYRLFCDYHAPLFNYGKLRMGWVGGLGLSLGDYGIKRYYVNGLGQEVSVKLNDGVIVGLIPVAGIRIYLFGQNTFDFMLEYHQYFGTPQRYIGGLALAPRFSFVF